MKDQIHSIKNQRSRRCKATQIEHKRWAAYATAALAGSFSFSLANSAEAEIHYSGPIDREIGSSSSITLPLGNDGHLVFQHYKHYFGTSFCTTSTCRQPNHLAPQTITRYYDGGSAFFRIYAPSGAVRGGQATQCTYLHSDNCISVSKLGKHAVISAGPFIPVGGFLVERSAMQWGGSGYPTGQFQAGLGAIGFKFNNGAGDQYGWVRVRSEGFPSFKFLVFDYAYGDPGDVVRVGRRQKPSDSVPAMESLGGLALGAAGLLAWRKSRSQAAR